MLETWTVLNKGMIVIKTLSHTTLEVEKSAIKESKQQEELSFKIIGPIKLLESAEEESSLDCHY